MLFHESYGAHTKTHHWYIYKWSDKSWNTNFSITSNITERPVGPSHALDWIMTLTIFSICFRAYPSFMMEVEAVRYHHPSIYILLCDEWQGKNTLWNDILYPHEVWYCRYQNWLEIALVVVIIVSSLVFKGKNYKNFPIFIYKIWLMIMTNLLSY